MVSIKVYTSGQFIEVIPDDIMVTIIIGVANENCDPEAIVLTKKEWMKICEHIAKEMGEEDDDQLS
jgi:hypothetical protein